MKRALPMHNPAMPRMPPFYPQQRPGPSRQPFPPTSYWPRPSNPTRPSAPMSQSSSMIKKEFPPSDYHPSPFPNPQSAPAQATTNSEFMGYNNHPPVSNASASPMFPNLDVTMPTQPGHTFDMLDSLPSLGEEGTKEVLKHSTLPPAAGLPKLEEPLLDNDVGGLDFLFHHHCSIEKTEAEPSNFMGLLDSASTIGIGISQAPGSMMLTTSPSTYMTDAGISSNQAAPSPAQPTNRIFSPNSTPHHISAATTPQPTNISSHYPHSMISPPPDNPMTPHSATNVMSPHVMGSVMSPGSVSNVMSPPPGQNVVSPSPTSVMSPEPQQRPFNQRMHIPSNNDASRFPSQYSYNAISNSNNNNYQMLTTEPREDSIETLLQNLD